MTNIRAMHRREFLQTGIAASALGLAASARSDVCADTASSDEVREIGSRAELFVDRWLIDREDGVALRLHPPEKREIVLTLDRPWEGPSSAYYTLLRDGAKFRLYYRGSGSFQRGNRAPIKFCLAESDDGVHFERPRLGLYEFQGSRDNNIVFQDPIAQDNFTPFLDANPRARADERYKALVSGGAGQLHAAASPDGLHWKFLKEGPISTDGSFDSLNIAWFDVSLGKYRMISRYLDVEGKTDNLSRNRAVWQEGTKSPWYRAIQSSTSDNFLDWAPAVPHVYAAGIPQEHFYTNATVPCPGAEHLWLSFPKRFIEERTLLPKEEHEHPGVSDALFMTSRDGVHWDRTFLEAWVRPGRDPRNWTERSNMVAWGIFDSAPDEHSLYISEHYEWPDNRLRRLAIRRHGFASMHAGVPGGEFTTKPLVFRGDRLTLNFATSAGGSVRVELQNAAGLPLLDRTLDKCRDLFGDDTARTVEWSSGSDLGSLAGRPVRLKFVLRDADVYALQFHASGA